MPGLTAPNLRRGATKFLRIKEVLRRRIDAGQLPAGSRLPAEIQLARSLKVNALTVGRALRELAEEGWVVRRRGSGTYVADRCAPPLILGRHLRLGVLWKCSVLPERMAHSFLGGITRGLLHTLGLDQADLEWPQVQPSEPTRAIWRAVTRGATVECIGEAWKRADRHPPLDAVRDGKFDGLIVLSVIEEDWLERLLELGIPAILVDFLSDPLAERADQVFVDSAPGYRGAVRHFTSLGLRRIHFLGARIGVPVPFPPEGALPPGVAPKRMDPDSHLRLGAYRQQMEAAGLPVSETWIHSCGCDPGELEGFAASLADLPENQRPEAVVCHALTHAELLKKVFASRNLPLCAAGTAEAIDNRGSALPIFIDPHAVGACAAQLLLWRLNNLQQKTMRVGVPMTFHPKTTAHDPIEKQMGVHS